MISLEECLAHLAVASWANNESALEVSRDSLRTYLNSVGSDPDSQKRALVEISHHFSQYKFDGGVADSIRRDISETMLDLLNKDAADRTQGVLLS